MIIQYTLKKRGSCLKGLKQRYEGTEVWRADFEPEPRSFDSAVVPPLLIGLLNTARTRLERREARV